MLATRQLLNKFGDLRYDSHVKRILLEVKQKNNIQSLKDWSKITKKHFELIGANSIFKNHSLFELKNIANHEHCKYISNNVIDKKVSEFILTLKHQFSINSFDDWNNVTLHDIKSIKNSDSLLKKYSILELKAIGCPEHATQFLNQINVQKPAKYWNEKNLKNFFIDLQNHYNLETKNDWIQLNSNQIKQMGGSWLLRKFTLSKLKQMACPEYKDLFIQLENKQKPNGYWNKSENIEKFIEKLKFTFQLNTPEDWNKLTWDQIKSINGGSLATKYSIYHIKLLGCPEVKKFAKEGKNNRKPIGYWDKKENIIKFLQKFSQHFNIKSVEDWNRVSLKQFENFGGSRLLQKYTFIDILSNILSNDQLKLINLNYKQKRSSQRWLFLIIQSIFPETEIIEDYFHEELSRESGYAVQFDIFIPSKNIAFEYHGIQHFEEIGSFAALELYRKRDIEKKKISYNSGIYLIIIPYSWDNKEDTLLELIKTELPQEVKLNL